MKQRKDFSWPKFDFIDRPMKIKFILYLLIICVSKVLFSQNSSISGQILDKNTGDPVRYASVFLQKTTRGTATNSKGYFTLDLKNVEIRGTEFYLDITCMGYVDSQFAFDLENESKLTIYLSENIIQLNEVIISPISEDPRKILGRVIGKIDNREILSQSYTSEYFYRSYTHTDGSRYSWFMESFGDWMSEGFHREHLNKKDHAYLKYYEFYKPRHFRGKLLEPWTDFIFNDRIRLPMIWSFAHAYTYLIPDYSRMNWYAYEILSEETHGASTVVSMKFDLSKKKRGIATKLLHNHERIPGFILSSGVYHINVSDDALEQIDFSFEAYEVKYEGILKFKKIGKNYYKHYLRIESEPMNTLKSYVNTDEMYWNNIKPIDQKSVEFYEKFGMKIDENSGHNSCAFLYNISKVDNSISKYHLVDQNITGLLLFLTPYDVSFWENFIPPSNEHRNKIYSDLNISEKDFISFDFGLHYEAFYRVSPLD